MPELVKSVMDPTPFIMPETANVGELIQVLGPKEAEAILLTDESGQLSGICTDKDLAYYLAKDVPRTIPIKQLMTKNPVVVGPSATLEEAVDKMTRVGCRQLPVILDNKIIGIVEILAIQRSIAKQLSERVQELKAAHEKILRRDEYLGIVAHDVRSPISVIKICADLLELLQKDQSLGYDQSDLIERIKFNADRAIRLVTDILDIGRLDRGLKLNFEEVTAQPYLEGIIENMRYSGKEREVTIKSELEAGIVVKLDKERYREILTNLIQNAVKFTAEGSEINVTAKYRPLNSLEGALEVAVKDQGPGIEPEKLKLLFNKYVQLETTGKRHGFGLGLSIAQAFTNLHNGKIVVDSELGKGATFTVIIPGAKLIK